MCFRPSPVQRGDDNQKACPTCGMPVSNDMDTCLYCGDPIPADPPNEFSNIDPAYSTRII